MSASEAPNKIDASLLESKSAKKVSLTVPKGFSDLLSQRHQPVATLIYQTKRVKGTCYMEASKCRFGTICAV